MKGFLPELYCLESENEPVCVPVQLNVANVPDMLFAPIRVPVNPYGQDVGTLGVSVIETDGPVTEPDSDPPPL